MKLDIRIGVREDGKYISSIETAIETTIPDASLVGIQTLSLGGTVDALVMAAIQEYVAKIICAVGEE